MSELSLLFLLAAIGYFSWLFLFARRGLPTSPSPPIVSGPIPFIGCGLSFIKNPRAFLEQKRAELGDTFLVRMFGIDLLFVFSPVGLKSLYQVREKDASFAEATKGLLGLKVPEETLDGTLRKFHQSLKRSLLYTYTKYVNDAVDAHISSMGQSGSIEVFSFMKQLVHRVGFLSWVGPEALDPRYLPRLIAAFEAMDPETGFKDLRSVALTQVTRKYYERKALAEMASILQEIWEQRQSSGSTKQDNLNSLHELYADKPLKERYHQVAIDVFQFHMASQANMYAALSWTLINLLTQGESVTGGTKVYLARVLDECKDMEKNHGPNFTESLDALESGLRFLEAFTQESLRLAQQSITLRKVMQPIQFSDEKHTYSLPVGCYLATLLSVTNVTEPPSDLASKLKAATLDKFEPSRYTGPQLGLGDSTPATEKGEHALDYEYSISTFGHGYHACPGQAFAIAVIKIIVCKLIMSFKFTPNFDSVQIPPSSVGAIARAQQPCHARYDRN